MKPTSTWTSSRAFQVLHLDRPHRRQPGLMKLRRRKTDRSVSLDETIDTGEDTLVREIAAWTRTPRSGIPVKSSARFSIRRSRASIRRTAPFSRCGI